MRWRIAFGEAEFGITFWYGIAFVKCVFRLEGLRRKYRTLLLKSSLARDSGKKLSNGRWDFGCQFFLWEDQLRRCLCGEGMCALVRYEDKGMEVCSLQGCSPAESGEGSGSSKSKQCQLCQVLSIKIKILEAKLEVAQSPEKHANTSSAILYEALEEVSDAVAGLSLDHQPNIS
ncbi:hypothetical protein KIW84_064746 [Lathyrus oleraceus]|uniref:Uncharacterized protein n=1 Tax=Pisum sativum TaxID=3888 RepID=A0A9D5A976_PEA|nr:hypothetical protein KIW84_064746 [Pisum sativum]